MAVSVVVIRRYRAQHFLYRPLLFKQYNCIRCIITRKLISRMCFAYFSDAHRHTLASRCTVTPLNFSVLHAGKCGTQDDELGFIFRVR